MDTLIKKDRWINRHEIPLPKQKYFIGILAVDGGREKFILCVWKPYIGKDEEILRMGFLGYATNPLSKTDYYAWDRIDSDFVYYRLFDYPVE